ncbi:hypothetical protein FH972_001359 [Carpinus fangiana]|uniref:Acetyltransferase n=1 Tax=Carpinus fangiana TaxID=176857 RepID=A0A5N6QE51_9ROSI|nr:hypothetical protein FH972_001359 [Carpinus fangiana]
MLSVHYIQKGGLFTRPSTPIDSLIALLKSGLSQTLSHFPPLAGRLRTDSDGYVYITCNDEGADFIHATASKLFIRDILAPTHVPDCVTELADGVFIGCSVNHAVVDGLYPELSVDFSGGAEITKGRSQVPLRASLAVRYDLRARGSCRPPNRRRSEWQRIVCRHRLDPKLDPYYFGNAIQSVPTVALAGDVLSRDLRWCAEQLSKNVMANDNDMVRRFIVNCESDPKCFQLGNFDGVSMTMGSSPRFPMYDNDFGWGRPLAVRSGRAN